MKEVKLTGKMCGIVLACLLIGGMSYGPTDYVGSDADGDGIGDTLYGIDSACGNYPLVEPLENDGATGVSLTLDHYMVYEADLSDVEPGKEGEIMEGVKRVMEGRMYALGYKSIVQVEKQGDEWSISIQLPGVADIEEARRMVGLFTVLEFREWSDEEGDWIPAVGTITVDGEARELALSSRYFSEDAFVNIDEFGRPFLVFKWNEEGEQLSEQITGRLIGKQLAVFLGDQPLEGDDGNIIAPVVRDVIIESGVIEGLSLVDAQSLSRLLNAGRIDVPLGRWVEEGQSKVFEPGVPLYEGQVTPIPSINWLLVGGIVGAVVAGLVILFVRRWRVA